MAKEKLKASPWESYLRVGNYAAVRRMSPPAEVLNRLEPNPLVFWIGVGSVALATLLALWLLSVG
jgi:hypothetical protein